MKLHPIFPAGPVGLLRMVGVLVCLAGMLVWVFFKAEAIDPEQHEAHERWIHQVQDLDARTDREMLAIRLELSRHYDTLTGLNAELQAQMNRVVPWPDHLDAEVRQSLDKALGELASKVGDKGQWVDEFKRHHAVLRNSLAYFPVAVGEWLTQESEGRLARWRTPVERYARAILVFAHSPGPASLAQAEQARQALLGPGGEPLAAVAHLVLHGDQIVRRSAQIDDVVRRSFDLGTVNAMDRLRAAYDQAHARVLLRVKLYRWAMYVLGLVLTGYLGVMFSRLERARQRLAVAHDEIRERLSAQAATEMQLRLHSTAFRNSHDGIILTNSQGVIVDVNPAFTRITGWARGEVVGRNPRVLRSGRHDEAFYVSMWQSIRHTGTWSGEVWNRNKFGEIYPELLSISSVRDESGLITHYVGVFSDIRRIKAQESQLTKMAYYDALTDLPNRVLLADRLAQGMAQTRRAGKLMAVAYLDLDGFKPVNDTWGHEAGDKVLVEIARRLKGVLRGGDTAARIGGDEFVVLFLGLEGGHDSQVACQRVLDAVSQPMAVLPDPVQLSASLGVTLYPQDNVDADQLLRHADQAMYLAKQFGKNRSHVFDAHHDRESRTQHDVVQRMNQALDEGELVLYYQPKVSLKTGKLVGCEALIRWQHPERGMLLPLDFLPYIEADELSCRLGNWVIRQALRQLAQWRHSGWMMNVSVNISGRHLQSADFLQDLQQALDMQPDVPPACLELEIQETTGLEDVVKVSEVMEACHRLGVSFAIDDFGTGYSSLTYLQRLPAQTVKIDKSFVKEVLKDPNNLVIVHSVTQLARSLLRNVVAEGVEDADQGRALLQMGCDQAQGDGIGPAMPAEHLRAWLEAWHPPSLWLRLGRSTWGEAVYPMLLAEVEHRSWVAHLAHAIEHDLAPPHEHLDNSHTCRFGRWYDQVPHTFPTLATDPVFHAIREPHERVHALAAEMDRLWRDGLVRQAQAKLPEVRVARDAVLVAIQLLAERHGTRADLPGADNAAHVRYPAP
ncbi:MAG TPA: EAL domain-containing protein [Burkholderiaceae bacterium]|nr:EAL domain-containing protein [Burkholderiaceae bacterium]